MEMLVLPSSLQCG